MAVFRCWWLAVGLCVCGALVAAAPGDLGATTCGNLHRCSECVFDASSGILSPNLDCSWCATTGTCMGVEDAGFAQCSDLRNTTHNPMCPDMMCAASQTTNNIYFCRWAPMVELALAAVLCVLSGVYFVWLRAVQQLPWRYDPPLAAGCAPTPGDPIAAQAPQTSRVTWDLPSLPASPGTLALSQTSPPTLSLQAGPGVFPAYPRPQRTATESLSMSRVLAMTAVPIEMTSPGGAVDDEAHHRQALSTDWGAASSKSSTPAQPQGASPRDPQRTGGSHCPICHVSQPEPLVPGNVCFWCGIARLGFIPLYIGVSCGTVTIILLFAVALKPWFADLYYAYLLLFAYGTYLIFAVYVCGSKARRALAAPLNDPLYLRLALRLRGRRLSSVRRAGAPAGMAAMEAAAPGTSTLGGAASPELGGPSSPGGGTPALVPRERPDEFPATEPEKRFRCNGCSPVGGWAVERAPASTAAAESATRPPADDLQGAEAAWTGAEAHGRVEPSQAVVFGELRAVLPPDLLQRKRAETFRLLHLEDSISNQLRRHLSDLLEREECILWCELPCVGDLLVDNQWLLWDFIAGALFGFWLMCVSTVTDPSYVLVRLAGPTAIGVTGVVILLGFALLLAIVVKNCSRIYLITDRRLLIVFDGFVSPTVSATSVESVRFAAIQGYRDWGARPTLTFSWESPMIGRELPPVKIERFAAVRDLQGLLRHFGYLRPRLSSDLQGARESVRHLRKVWRIHLFFSILLVEVLPILTIYSMVVPMFLCVVLVAIVLLAIGATIHRGIRVQRFTALSLTRARSCWPAWRLGHGTADGSP